MLHVQMNGITAEKYAEIAAELQRRSGLTLAGSDGVAEVRGFRIGYAYQPKDETLRIQLLSKPWFVPESLLRSKIDQYLPAIATQLALPPVQWL